MKTIASISCSLVLFIVFGVASKPVYAEEEVVTTVTIMQEEQQLPGGARELTSQVVQKAEYTLPYPGILPDHPLYFLKRLRDTILEKLIADPIRKTEFYILQADKRLQMGVMLFDSQKGPLGESTISKGEKYMEQAISGLASYKGSGSPVPPYVIERLEKATAKHKEVIAELLTKAGEAEKAGLEGSLSFVNQLIEKLPSLK